MLVYQRVPSIYGKIGDAKNPWRSLGHIQTPSEGDGVFQGSREELFLTEKNVDVCSKFQNSFMKPPLQVWTYYVYYQSAR
jgi:hypothetical protein